MFTHPLAADFEDVSLNIAALMILAPACMGTVSTARGGDGALKSTLLGGAPWLGFRGRLVCEGGRELREADTVGRCGLASCLLCWVPSYRAGSQASSGLLDSCPSWPRTTESLLPQEPGPEEPLSMSCLTQLSRCGRGLLCKPWPGPGPVSPPVLRLTLALTGCCVAEVLLSLEGR